jgi:hypothetical protein
MKTKYISFFLFVFFLLSEMVMACPSCAGSMTNPREKYIIYALGGFILFSYVPMFILYRLFTGQKGRKNF